jgi:hypothetical protein
MRATIRQVLTSERTAPNAVDTRKRTPKRLS